MSTLFYVVISPSVSGSLNTLGLFLVVQRGVGKSFPWSQLLAYQPHNKGSLWVAAGGGPSRVCSHGWCLCSPRAGLVSSGLNSPPPSPEMESGAIAVVPATDMWGVWKKKRAIYG